MKMSDQDKSWAPHFCCGSCRSTLERWMHGSRKCMPFAILQIWKEPTNHHDDCYFCMVDISKYKKTKDRKKIVYPSIPSSIAPLNHAPELPIPQLPTTHAISSTSSEDDDTDFEVDTQSVPAKILVFRIKMNWMISLETWVLQRQKQRYFLLVSRNEICLLLRARLPSQENDMCVTIIISGIFILLSRVNVVFLFWPLFPVFSHIQTVACLFYSQGNFIGSYFCTPPVDK